MSKTSSPGSDDTGASRWVGRIGDAAPLVLGAVGFAALLVGRLWMVDEYSWAARDDAVITLSHARNAADFGTIGVSPGDRVEGFSSPLQFIMAFVVESFSSPSYRSLSLLLLVAAVGAAGTALAVGFRWIGVSSGLDGRAGAAITIGLPVVVGALTAASWTAVGWLGSGMENPWLVAAGFVVAAASLAPVTTQPVVAVAAVGLFALSIGRVEFAAFTPPLIFATGWVLARRQVGGRRWRTAIAVVAPPLLGIAVVHLTRRWYFGEWLPNTAVVQGRAGGADQLAGLALILLIAVVVSVALVLRDDESVGDSFDDGSRRLASVGVRSAGIALVGLLVWWSASGRTAAPLQDLVLFPPLLPLLVSIGVLLELSRAAGLGGWPPNAVFAGLTLVPLAQYVVMGPARLDGYRVLSIVVPFAAAWINVLLVRLWWGVRPAARPGFAEPAPDHRRIRRTAVAVVVSGLVIGTTWGAANDGARYLNYAISGTDRVLAAADSVRERELGDAGLPLLANPDLGKVSFAKRAIITDLGLLGDPVLTRVVTERNDLMPTYLTAVVHPDVVEVHGGFSCAYGPWLASVEFGDRHESPDEAWQGELDADGCFLAGRSAVWFRTDAADEYALSRALIDADTPAAVVAVALAECAAASQGPFRCEGVRRSVQRVSEDIRGRGEFDAVVAEFRRSPSAELATALLRRGPGWGDLAFAAFVNSADAGRRL